MRSLLVLIDDAAAVAQTRYARQADAVLIVLNNQLANRCQQDNIGYEVSAYLARPKTSQIEFSNQIFFNSK